MIFNPVSITLACSMFVLFLGGEVVAQFRPSRVVGEEEIGALSRPSIPHRLSPSAIAAIRTQANLDLQQQMYQQQQIASMSPEEYLAYQQSQRELQELISQLQGAITPNSFQQFNGLQPQFPTLTTSQVQQQVQQQFQQQMQQSQALLQQSQNQMLHQMLQYQNGNGLRQSHAGSAVPLAYASAFRGQLLGPEKYHGECAAGVQHVFSSARKPLGSTSTWKPGKFVKGNNIQPGTAIATFSNGNYKGHAAIFIRQARNGIEVWDQWGARYNSQGKKTREAQPWHTRPIWFDDTKSTSNNANRFRVVK